MRAAARLLTIPQAQAGEKSMRNALPAAWAMVALAAAPSTATVYFQNTGTTSGCDYVTHDGGGSVTQVSSPVYQGSTANRHYQVWQGGDRTLHSETGKRGVGQNG